VLHPSPAVRDTCRSDTAAGLGVCRIATGKYTGQTTVEISVNGQRVGQLTKAQADKYLPTVQAELAAGRKPACQVYVSRTRFPGHLI
jgi:hypothetical protein